MTTNKMALLARQCARYKAMLGENLAAIVEGDTGVMTTRMSTHQRSIAYRYRAAVQQLAGC